MTYDHPPLAGGVLDRDVETRLDDAALSRAWCEPEARLLMLRGAQVPVVRESGQARLSLVPTRGEFVCADTEGRIAHVFIGRTPEGSPVFAASDTEDVAEADPHVAWQHPFDAVSRLSEIEREIVSVASALLRWHESARFSPIDGSVTAVEQGGWMRRDAHGGELFPRTDPAVIVRIEHEDQLLLGSNALWESGRFSLLAGFVEAGESLEEAVRREVFEESGVRLGRVRYITSQPWPFPRSLMLGFSAELAPGVDPEHLTPDPAEISELRWFSRDQLRDPAPGLRLPQSLSIARWLIDHWLDDADVSGRSSPGA